MGRRGGTAARNYVLHMERDGHFRLAADGSGYIQILDSNTSNRTRCNRPCKKVNRVGVCTYSPGEICQSCLRAAGLLDSHGAKP